MDFLGGILEPRADHGAEERLQAGLHLAVRDPAKRAEQLADAVEMLLAQLPESAQIWRELSERYTVQLRLALHMEGWNKGFTLTKQLTNRLAALGVDVEFDLYAYGEQDA